MSEMMKHFVPGHADSSSYPQNPCKKPGGAACADDGEMGGRNM